MIGPRINPRGKFRTFVKRLYYVMPVVTYIRAAFRPYRGGGSPPRGRLRARRRSWPSAPLRCASPARAIKRNQVQSRAIHSNPQQSRVPRLLKLGLLGHRVVTQIDRLRSGLRGVAAPGLTPEPLLGQGVDGHLMRDAIRRSQTQSPCPAGSWVSPDEGRNQTQSDAITMPCR